MPISRGTAEIASISVGTREVLNVSRGTVLIWSSVSDWGAIPQGDTSRPTWGAYVGAFSDLPSGTTSTPTWAAI